MNFFAKAGSKVNSLYGKARDGSRMLGKLSSQGERIGSAVEKGSKKIGNVLGSDAARAIAVGLGGPSGLLALEAGRRIASGAQNIGSLVKDASQQSSQIRNPLERSSPSERQPLMKFQ